jgi:hypothetical protein
VTNEARSSPDDSTVPAAPYCPSTQPDVEGAVAIGVVGGSVDAPRLGYLQAPLAITPELLELAAPVEPTEVFRFAGPCALEACQHFDGSRCRLIDQLIPALPAVVSTLPQCRLRPRCRWWLQDGADACLRCPMVVTREWAPTEELAAAARPAAEGHDVAR